MLLNALKTGAARTVASVRAMRHFSLVAAVACGLALAPGGSAAQNFPSETIHVVVPWNAGGGTDRIGRAISSAIEEAAGVSVVVDNISGAGGITGSLNVARSDPDGYTLLMNGSSDMTAAMVFQDVPISLDDFTFIGGFFTSPTWILAHSDRGYQTLDDLLAAAREAPGTVTLGTAGPSGAQMLMAAAIQGVTDLDIRIVPFSGGADLTRALLGDQVHAGIIHAPVMLGEAREGIIDVLGTGLPLSELAYEPLRTVATLRDSGIPVDIGITRGIYVPKDTPEDVVARLSEIVEQAATSDGFAEFGANFGFNPVWIPGDEFETQVRAQLDLFRQIRTDHIE